MTASYNALTKPQFKALKIIGEDDLALDVRVIGWDTSVQGPLLRVIWRSSSEPDRIAISPKGRHIKRPIRTETNA